MKKIAIKEFLLIILLIIAIVLILGIIFYQYVPKNKTIPAQVKAYTLAEDIEQELKEKLNTEQENIVKTLYIDNSDLKVYESKKEYNKGKANPFADYSENKSNTNSNNSDDNNTKNTTSGTTTNSNNTNNINNKTDKVSSQNKEDQEVYVTSVGKNY